MLATFDKFFKKLIREIFSKETLWGLLLCLIILAILIFTVDDTPLWLYQGF